jgi:serine/threonine-protein kinase HipA
MNSRVVTIQAHLAGNWHDAAMLTVETQAGSAVEYELGHCLRFDRAVTGTVNGAAALSVRLPLNLDWKRFAGWPPFLQDMMPHGQADFGRLLRSAGAPVGNLRIKEAWQAERERLAGIEHPGVTLDQVFARDAAFMDLLSLGADGCQGVPGAWPKMLLTQQRDGKWLPDPMVPDGQAMDHAIVKWVPDGSEVHRLMLETEPLYLELARRFGLRSVRPVYQDGTLLIPRFDRVVAEGRVVRLGQERLALAALGHSHEDNLAVLKQVCTKPVAEITEYLLRQLLNLALGNPDNGGGNMALQKLDNNAIRLSPLFGISPACLTGMRPAANWACMHGRPGIDWERVCDVAAAGVMKACDLKRALSGKSELLRRLPDMAQETGVPDRVIAAAMGQCGALADDMARLSYCHGLSA